MLLQDRHTHLAPVASASSRFTVVATPATALSQDRQIGALRRLGIFQAGIQQ
jgi:hypothetical protein